MNPFPSAYTYIDGKKLKIYKKLKSICSLVNRFWYNIKRIEVIDMRGAKGGFWDMLFSRVRKRKIQKKKNDEMKLENESLKSKKLEQTKKENSK